MRPSASSPITPKLNNRANAVCQRQLGGHDIARRAKLEMDGALLDCVQITPERAEFLNKVLAKSLEFAGEPAHIHRLGTKLDKSWKKKL